MELSRRRFIAAAGGTLSLAAGLGAQRPPAARDVPWLAEVQTPPRQLPTELTIRPLNADAQGNRLESLDQWQVQRGQIREAWLNLLGAWPSPRRPPVFEIIESERTPRLWRQLIRFQTEWGVNAEAYLLQPSRIAGKAPGVVVFHSTVDYTIRQGAGLEGPASAAWGVKLAERGFVVLCPRCFLWDNSSRVDFATRVNEHLRRHPNAKGMAKMLGDGMRAVDLLASLPQVDAGRLGAAGHSLGAKETLYLAAFDERIKAAVASEGGVGTQFSNWDAAWYLGTKHFGREHHELLGLVAPRAFLVIGGESADGDRTWPFIDSALAAYRFYGEPQRIGLFNHRQGHTIPLVAEQRTYEWLETYL